MVIDLGDLDRAVGATDHPPWRVRLAAARPAAAVALFLLVLTLGASAGPLPRLRSILVATDMPGAFALSSSALFASDPGSQALLRRYPLGGRSPQWSTEVPQPVGTLDLAESARVLVASSPDRSQTAFLDSDTGAVLRRTTPGETIVLRLSADSGLITSAAGSSGVALQRVDLRTGTPLWSRGIDPGGYLDAGDPAFGEPSRIVTVDRRGHAAVLGFADGAVLATAEFAVVPDPGGGGTGTARFTAFGDHLYAVRRDGAAPSLTAYRLADLRQVWRNTTAWGRPTWCGRYVCVATASGMTVLDGGTGAERWSTTRWRLGFDTRAFGLPGPPRLAVTDGRVRPERALLDPATGRVRTLLGDSIPAGPFVLRSDRTRIGRTWIQVAGRGDDFRTVGHRDDVAPERCTATGGLLACSTARGQTVVWRVSGGPVAHR
jgi:hypothetical protein